MKQLCKRIPAYFFISLLFGVFTGLQAQVFVEVNTGITALSHSSVSWGDYDNDKDLDILISGAASGDTFITKIYANENGNFTDINANLEGTYKGIAIWGDYDNDSDLDILVTGDNIQERTYIYKNESGIFSGISTELNYFGPYSSACWGDYDNDGDLDAFITGGWNSILYRNDGSDIFTGSGLAFEMLVGGRADWGDCDGDGDLDLLLTGDTGGGMKMYLYINNDGTFDQHELVNMGLATGSVKWGDYDADGDLDIMVSGFDNWIAPQANIYRNDGNLVFTNIYAGLAPVAMGNAVWADYDNDGDLDAAVTGKLSGCGVFMTEIYENLGNDLFNSITAGLPFAENSFIAWGDYDNDTDLDILVTGNSYSGGPFTKLFRNDFALPNLLPQAPQNLSVDFNGNTAMLSWEDGSDPQTPAPGLSYNVRIGTQPLNCNSLSPMSHISDGYRKVISMGNTSLTNMWMVKNLVPGTSYYWSVQTIDNTFAGSGFSEEQSFTFELTGLKENGRAPELSFYPNPVNDIIFLKNSTGISKSKVNIYSITGEMVKQGEISTTTGFSVSDLKPGVYFIEMEQNNKRSLNKLIIK